MPNQHRQKTDAVPVSRVLLLCMATTLVVGFSKPVHQPEDLAVAGLADATSGETTIEPVALAEPDILPVTRSMSAGLPRSRPQSFVTSTLLQPVLTHVSLREWMVPLEKSRQSTGPHPTDELPGHFYGVGFPEIRTHRAPGRLVTINPAGRSNWRRMITWRDSGEESRMREPIAHVRCMGLSPQAVARRADRYEKLILKYALKYDVSASLIKAIITEESCFNNDAVSPVGALGLMQLMPETAQWLKVKDPKDPAQNLRAGIRYIASLQKQFDSLELALAAYNAGPGNVRRYKGVPPFAETQAYVQKVQAHYRRYVAATRLAAN